jgi:hypothetical protein
MTKSERKVSKVQDPPRAQEVLEVSPVSVRVVSLVVVVVVVAAAAALLTRTRLMVREVLAVEDSHRQTLTRFSSKFSPQFLYQKAIVADIIYQANIRITWDGWSRAIW